ncbi:hypothetical protein H9P43_005857 [Blastocladiella emersonii ATCC 22665]|nr:hypothetical protein H9P43_005857 [Blastocladiella emersonii ATCC 22665]
MSSASPSRSPVSDRYGSAAAAAGKKRRLTPGDIELHPNEPALVVHYTISDSPDEPPIPAQKVIHIKSLTPTTDLPSLAAEIAAKCKLIHPSKVGRVVGLLQSLLARGSAGRLAPGGGSLSSSGNSGGGGSTSSIRGSLNSINCGGSNVNLGPGTRIPPSSSSRASGSTSPNAAPPPASSRRPSRASVSSSATNLAASFAADAVWEGDASPDSDEPARLEDLEGYIELLYEDLPTTIRSTRQILKLAVNHEHLESLAGNESLLSALARTLREDTRKSMELGAAILGTFHQFALCPQFRGVLTSNKVGDMCVKQIDYEIKRLAVLREPLAALRDPAAPATAETRKAVGVLARQDAVLYSAISILLQLAEDPAIQAKMVKRGITGSLLALVDRPTVTQHSAAVVQLMVQFLVVLTQFRENVEAIRAQPEAVGTLVPLVQHPSMPLVNDVLRVFLNLSHDHEWRNEMMRMGLVAHLVDVLHRDDETSPELLLLLYQISCDERSKAIFTYTDALPQVMKLILKYPRDHVSVELMTLAINLAVNEHNAEVFAENGGLKFLVKRLVLTRDYLLLKMLRNMSAHAALHLAFLDHIDDLMALFVASTSRDVHVEVLGLLANLRVPDMDYAKLAAAYNLVPYIAARLAAVRAEDTLALPGTTAVMPKASPDDDLALEVVQLVATLALDDAMGEPLAAAGIPSLLLGLMRAREDDDEMVLQMLVAFHALLHVPATRAQLLPDLSPGTDLGDDAFHSIPDGVLVAFLIDLLYDRNPQIRAACDRCLDAICDLAVAGEPDPQVVEWARRIRIEKFHFHNAEWISLVSGHAGAGAVSGVNAEGVCEDEDEESSRADQALAHAEALDHDDGNEHHAAEMFGHVKLVYA